MSRVLVVVPPLTGHVNPTVSLGAELSDRGHEVAWAGLPGVVDRLLPGWARFVPLVGDLDQRGFDDMQEKGRGLRGPEALKFLWEGFIIPYAAATIAELRGIAEAFEPDVMVVDQQAVGGAVVARLLGIPWVTSATTSAELTDPLSGLPKVDDWVRGQLLDLQIGCGIDPGEAQAAGDLRFSDHLILAFTTEALLGDTLAPALSGAPIRFVGPSVEARSGGAGDDAAFPWHWLDPDRLHVLVTLGTVNASIGGRFFGVAAEALAGSDMQVVMIAPPGSVDIPQGGGNILVAERVPQLALLPHMDAVVAHGGHNTVCEALAEGLPLVLAPIRDDQPIVAEQVVRAGAGMRVKFGRVGAAELRASVEAVLSDASYRSAAGAIRRSFDLAGGAAAAAAAVDELLLAKESTAR
ncbi:MAG TPA: nucleotide disphospho-sugar-binding domain-containing protein [Acidimicrobiales bacterium]|nr:nucleotide disphospho-sugar-binding domain-containing protein [Acidimicrobiales bacterium]